MYELYSAIEGGDIEWQKQGDIYNKIYTGGTNMKRKLIASVISTMTCVCMLGTTCLAAGGTLTGTSADADKKISGDSTVKSPIYSVVVPTTVEFGIDAFEQAGQLNSQIASADLPIYNKSNVAVRVQADVKLTPANGVTLVDDTTKVTEDNTNKVLYMGLEVPKTVAMTLGTAADATGADATTVASYTKHSDNKLYLTTGLTTDETASGGAFNGESAAAASDIKTQEINGSTITYAAGTTADPQYIVTLGTDAVSVAFALDKAEYYKVYSKSSDTTGTDKFYKAASTTDGAAAFRLTGAVNSRAAWAAQDVKAEITYSFLGIRNANYATQSADASTDNPNIAYVANTAKLLKESAGPEFTTSSTVGIVTYTVGDGNDALASITDVAWEFEGNTMSVLGSNVTLDATAKTLTLTSGAIEYWASQGATKTATVTYKTTGNVTKTANITFNLQ